MKRVLLIFSVFASILIGNIFYKDLANYKYRQMNNLGYHQLLDQGFQLSFYSIDIESEEAFEFVKQLFIRYAGDERLAAFTIYDSETNIETRYLTSEEVYQQYLTRVPWNQLKNQCITNNIHDQECIGNIENAKALKQDPRQKDYYIRDLQQLHDVTYQEGQSYNFHFFTKQDELLSLVLKNECERNNLYLIANDNYTELGRKDVFTQTKKVGLILGFVYFLLFIVLFLQNKKQLSIYKLHGFSNTTIIKKYYAPIILKSLLIFSVLLLIYPVLIEQSFTLFVMTYVQSISMVLLVVVLLVGVLVGMLFMMLGKVQIALSLKNTSNDFILNMIYVIKFMMIIGIVPSLVFYSNEMKTVRTKLSAFNEHAFYKEYYFIDARVGRNEYQQLSRELHHYMNDNQGLYINHGIYFDDLMRQNNYLYMNHNAASRFFSVYSLDEQLDYVLYHEGTELEHFSRYEIPLTFIQIEKYAIPLVIPIFSVENIIDTAMDLPILVSNHLDDFVIGTPRFPEYLLPLETQANTMKQLQEKEAFMDAVPKYMMSVVEEQRSYLQSTYINYLFVFIGALGLLLLIVYSNVFIMFDKNRKIYTVETLFGYPMYKTFKKIYLMIFLETIVLLVTFTVFMKLSFMMSLGTLFMLMIIEMIFASIFILYFKKQSIISLTKGNRVRE